MDLPKPPKGMSPVEGLAVLGTPGGAADKLKLFEALGTNDGVLNFGNVVLNDLHVLRSITLRNLTSDRLCINIRCKSAQLQDQVFFQLENQNLGVQDEQAIQAVFNEINHIDKFFLEPLAEQQLVVSVRPRDQKDPNEIQKDEQMASRQALDDQGAMSHMRYHSFSLKATIKMTAVVTTANGLVKFPLTGPTPTSVAICIEIDEFLY